MHDDDRILQVRVHMVHARRALERAQAEFDEAFRQFEALTDEPLPWDVAS